MENPIKIGWFGGTTIFGNIHLSPKFAGRFAQAASATLPVGSMACCEGSYLAASPKPRMTFYSNDVMTYPQLTRVQHIHWCCSGGIILAWSYEAIMTCPWFKDWQGEVYQVRLWNIEQKNKKHMFARFIWRGRKRIKKRQESSPEKLDIYIKVIIFRCSKADICSQLNEFAKSCFFKSLLFQIVLYAELQSRDR